MMQKPIWKSKPSIQEVRKQARAFFAQDPNNKDKKYDEARGCVNTLRHLYTNYDQLRYSVRVEKQLEDENPEINLLKNQVLDLIIECCPSLKTECLRQKDWLSGRMSALLSKVLDRLDC
jgi:hypothetical protein